MRRSAHLSRSTCCRERNSSSSARCSESTSSAAAVSCLKRQLRGTEQARKVRDVNESCLSISFACSRGTCAGGRGRLAREGARER